MGLEWGATVTLSTLGRWLRLVIYGGGMRTERTLKVAP